MGLKIRKSDGGTVLRALVQEVNRLRDAAVGANIHYSATPAAQNLNSDPLAPTVLSVSITLTATLAGRIATANHIKGVLNHHFRDTGAHGTAFSPVITTADATDAATARTLLTACKTAYGTHRTLANAHGTNDTTNTIAAADATDDASFDTLATELKADITAHIAAALAGYHIELIPG